jgi:tetratricopeptide (TPR) repeat protein/CHAT domain-containing protein
MPKFVYPASFFIYPADDMVERRPELRHMSARLAHDYAEKRSISEAELQAVGAALWHALPVDTSDRFEAAIQTSGANILSIVIESRMPAIQTLPWETLYHPWRGFLARNTAFALSRRIAPPSGDLPPARLAPLKVLLFTSLPDDLNPETERLNVEKEQERVQEALLPFIAQGRVQLEIPDDGRLETLIDLLKRFEPHVLYLSGHGKFVHQPGSDREPFGIFLFESDTGKGDPVTEEKLAQVLMGSGVQVIVLSACESGKAASDDLNHGLARRLAAMGVPHVLGMRESVLDEAGIQFADALCKALAEGERVDVAIQAARAAMTVSAGGVSRRETNSAVTPERLQGEWCLPMLISPEPSHPPANWSSFVPNPRRVGKPAAPVRFIGRRKELRRYKHRLLTGDVTRLLVTGAGGHGKTALARKLARELEQREYVFFEWRADTPWRDFQQTLELTLDDVAGKTYDRFAIRLQDQPGKVAQKLFELLDAQFEGRVVLLFDNLESIQDDKTCRLTDPQANIWLNAACASNLIVLATSRWVLPDWNCEHLPLESMNKGDFLSLAQTLTERGQMNPLLLAERERLNQAYETLGHNPRGLEWFAPATLTMDPQEEQTFAERLVQTRADLRQNMALEETLNRLSPEAQTLLRRVHVYKAPIPVDGIIKLGLDLPDPEAAFDILLAFSLLEITESQDYETLEYQTEPTLLSYLHEKNLLDHDPHARNAAADFLLWLMDHERKTYSHLALTIEAVRRAERHPEADKLTLDILVGKYTRDGRYAELLARWLPQVINSRDKKMQAEALGQTGKLHFHLGNFKEAMPYFQQSLAIRQQIGDKAGEGTTLNNISQIFKAQGDYETALTYLKQSLAICQQIGDKAGEGTTLNNISALYHAQGDYETALTYLKQSLAICQQIGDKAGLCATLFNMGHIHAQNNQMQEAVNAWVTVYMIGKQINEFQVLQALSKLAPQLGLPEGLEGWETLSQRMSQDAGNVGGEEPKDKSEEEQITEIVQRVVKAVQSKSPEGS